MKKKILVVLLAMVMVFAFSAAAMAAEAVTIDVGIGTDDVTADTKGNYVVPTDAEVEFTADATGFEEDAIITYEWFVKGTKIADATAATYEHEFTADGKYEIKVVATVAGGGEDAEDITATKEITVYVGDDDTSLALKVGGKDVTKKTNSRGDVWFEYEYAYNADEIKFDVGLAYGTEYEISDDDDLDIDEENAYFTVELGDEDDYVIEITVTAYNGDEVDYELYLERMDKVVLDGFDINIEGGKNYKDDLDFVMFPGKYDEDITEYYLFVPFDEDSSKIRAVLAPEYDDDDYTVKVNNVVRGDGKDSNIIVNEGANGKFTIVITDDETGASTTYTVYVYYADEDADDDAILNGITVKYGNRNRTEAALSPAFSSSVYNYSVSLPAKTTEALITIEEPRRQDAMIFCNGELINSTSFTVGELKAGANIYEIAVVAEDMDTINTYKVTINVGEAAGLSNLVFTFNGGTYYTAPAFATGLFNYVAAVPNNITSLNVTPTAVDNGATINIYNGSVLVGIAKSGVATNNVTLKEGLNEIKVTVTSGKTTQTYVLNVYRQAAAPVYKVSNQTLSINGYSKAFNAVNINGNNFVRLRDIASALNGTAKNFSVVYNGADNNAAMTSKTAYTPDPNNPDNQPVVFTNPQPTNQTLSLDGKTVYVVAYNVGGSNYVNLRQIGALLDINISYNANTKLIALNTAFGYTSYQN
jgi:hypothetical protein